MESANIIPVNIEDEMRGSYLDYAMSVIISRALPDARDGLKPVHRRILYAMLREGLTSSRRYSKCAGVVGEVLKKYHPHGDSAVYNALVRLAQSWAVRYPLIDGQGNFGSIDGDSPAAYRYTECRMEKITENLLSDIDKETVDFTPNFDEQVLEPVVLPSRVPNLLVNGGEGIAVGMASSIPPHNLGEVVDGAIAVIDNPDISVEDLMGIIPAPDFPTGGVICGLTPIYQMYKTGKGILKVRGRSHTEVIKRGSRDIEAIIIDEVPYQVNKAKLIEKIAELVRDKKIEGISNIRDESDRNGMRVVVELKRDATDAVVLNQLYKLTPFKTSYGATLRAIVDGKPVVLTLKAALSCFIDHRREVVVRRTKFELKKAKARLHILDGFRIALENIDDVIKLIKESESTSAAKSQLISKYSLSDIQAQQILDMPLKRLTGLERKAIEDEYNALKLKVEDLEGLLADQGKIDSLIKSELEEVNESYRDERRTGLEDSDEDIDLEDLIEEEDMVVTISHKGYLKRCSPTLYKAQNRGGKGVQATKKTGQGDDADFIEDLFVASTHAYLLVFTNLGKLYWLKVHRLPEAGRTARGRAIVNMLNLSGDEVISAIQSVRTFDENTFVVIVTKDGYVKRVDAMDFSNPRKGGIRALSLNEGDEVIGALITGGESDILVSTKSGMSIRFDENDVRAMGRTARGVRGIKLSAGDAVVSIVKIGSELNEKGAILTVCENGYGKRTEVSQYKNQNRGGKGVIDIKTSDRNGDVVDSLPVMDEDEVMIITNRGKVIRTPVSGISIVGRNTQGVRLINTDGEETVASVACLVDESDDESEE